ncbi:MAG: hypothetical protein ACK4QW_09975 [Alphaproteobacteria bacterium]
MPTAAPDRAMPLTPAERVRRHRRRRRLGLDTARVEVDRWQLAEWMIENRILSEDDVDRPGKIDAALSGVVAELIKRKKM